MQPSADAAQTRLAQGHHIPRNLLLKLLKVRQIPPATLAVWVDVLNRRDPVYALQQLGLLESASAGMPDIGLVGRGAGRAGAQGAAEVDCPDWLYLSLPALVSDHAHVPYLVSQLLSPRFARMSEEHRGLFAARCVQHFIKVRHYVALRETVEWIAYSSPDDTAALTSSRSFERLLAALASERVRANTLAATPLHVLRPLVDLIVATMHARSVPRTLGTYLPLLSNKLIPREPREAMRLVVEMAQAGHAPHKDVLLRVVGVMARSGEFTSAAELLDEIRALRRERDEARAWVTQARREDAPLDKRGVLEDDRAQGEEDEEEEFVQEDEEAVQHRELRRVKELRLDGGLRQEAAALAVKPPRYSLEFLADDSDAPPSAVSPPAPSTPPGSSSPSPNFGHDIYATTQLLDPTFSRPYFQTLIDYTLGSGRAISFPEPPFRFDGVAWTNLFRMAASQPDIPAETLVTVADAVEQAANSPDLRAASAGSARAYRPPAPSIRIYTILLRALHQRNENRAALDLWRSLDAREFQPDGHMLDALVRVLCALGRDEAALRLLEFFGVVRNRDDKVVIPTLTPSRPPRQRTLRGGTVRLDVVPFNVLLAHYNRTGAHERVYALWGRLEERYGVRPDAATLSIVLDAARFAGVAAGRATGWTAGALDDVALGRRAGAGLGAGSGAAVDDRWGGRPAHKLVEEFIWRDVLEANWQDADVRNPVHRTAAQKGASLAGWLADKLGRAGASARDDASAVDAENSQERTLTAASGQDLARPRGWYPFATTLSPTPPAHPHLYPNDRVFRSLIQLVGTHSHLRDIPLVLAWMRRARVRPSRWTLCLAMAYIDGDAGIRPQQSVGAMLPFSKNAVLATGVAIWSGAQVALVNAHMSPWLPSMYGVGPNWAYDAGNPVEPIGPDLQNQDDWWFRGPKYRALKPQGGAVTDLPAGGSIDIEIACHVAWTSYGVTPTDPNAELSACPDNYGAYHTGDPAGPLEDSLLSGCALAIADKDDIEKVGWDDLTVFSVNHNCVRQKVTSFEVPEQMPACTGDKCICAWLWLANTGTANFYMTAFDCRTTDVDASLARPILPPVDPVFCPASDKTCKPATGAKRPLYAYNQPTNVKTWSNANRPGYHADWSFPNDGPQNDIFDLSGTASPASSAANSTSSSAGSQLASSPSSIGGTRSSAPADATSVSDSAVTTDSPASSISTAKTRSWTRTRTRASMSKPVAVLAASPESATIAEATTTLSTLLPSSSSIETANSSTTAALSSTTANSSMTDALSPTMAANSTTSSSSRRYSHTKRPAHHHLSNHRNNHRIGDIVSAIGDVLKNSSATAEPSGASANAEVGTAAKLSLRNLERRSATSDGARTSGMASLAGVFVFTLALVALQ
ncbi:hypothetical protein JCM3770_006164 [Rhodotorula araucariae]